MRLGRTKDQYAGGGLEMVQNIQKRQSLRVFRNAVRQAKMFNSRPDVESRRVVWRFARAHKMQVKFFRQTGMFPPKQQQRLQQPVQSRLMPVINAAFLTAHGSSHSARRAEPQALVNGRSEPGNGCAQGSM